MGRILKAFAGDQLQVIEEIEKRTPERQKLIDKGYQLHTELEQKLSGEERELLEKLLDNISDESCRYAEDKFIRGYRLGVLMTMEVFSEQETFFDGKGGE